MQLTRVYLDIYFAGNMLADILVIIMFCLIVSVKVRILRVIYASVTGSLLSCVLLMMPSCAYVRQTGGVCIAVIMFCIIFYGSRMHPAAYIRYIIIFYLTSFMAGGIVRLFSDGDILHITGLAAGLAIAAFTVGFVSQYGGLSDIRIFNNSIAEITVIQGKRRASGTGYYDSGNGMYEPVSGALVILASADSLKDYLTEGEKKYIDVFPKLPDEWDGATYIRAIPYSSIGTARGILPGIRTDKIILKRGKRIAEYSGCYIAVYSEPLSTYERYDFILHRDMKAFISGR